MSTTSKPPCIAILRCGDNTSLIAAFRALRPDIDVRAWPELGRLEDIEAVACWSPPPGVCASLPRLVLIQSLGAGIDHLEIDAELPRGVPVCRIVDPGATTGMVSYVSWAVAHRHRRMDVVLRARSDRHWLKFEACPTISHTVGIAGMGQMGRACAVALNAMGYSVRGWSNSAKADLPAYVAHYHGATQLDDFLAACDTLVCLLPLTIETRGFLCASLFSRLPEGAHVINVGRGAHLNEADLLAALSSGHIAGATLDVFMQEPLPPEHPFWDQEQVLITPHMATRASTLEIARQTLLNLDCVRRGNVPEFAVDVDRGY